MKIRKLKRTGVGLAALFLLLLIFRGALYRAAVNYQSLGERPIIQLNEAALLRTIDHATGEGDLDLAQIVAIARKFTNQHLQFRAKATTSDPNQVVLSGKAHCVGYSALFASVADYVIQSQHLQDRYRVRHYIGQLYFLGYNVHRWTDHSFFQDHDFNGIEDISTGEAIFIDPSVSDYLGIHRVKKTGF